MCRTLYLSISFDIRARQDFQQRVFFCGKSRACARVTRGRVSAKRQWKMPKWSRHSAVEAGQEIDWGPAEESGVRVACT